MSQATLDEALGEALRDDGVRKVDLAEPQTWRDECDRAIAYLAGTGDRFTAEDVRELIGDPLHPNAFGARFLAAARSGLIVKRGYHKSGRASLHRHPIAVWEGAAP